MSANDVIPYQNLAKSMLRDHRFCEPHSPFADEQQVNTQFNNIVDHDDYHRHYLLEGWS